MNANTINSKNVISGVNDLATKCPKISAMWSAKNTYTPSEVSVGSNKKAWFVCPDCKQEFEARVFHIARSLMRGNTGCPVCAGLKVVPGINDLATKCPKIFAMWSAKNTYTPSEVSAGSNKKVWFICPDCKQEFEASICNVVHTVQNGSKATCIAYHGVNNITVKFEDGFVLYHARWNQFVRGALHHNQKNINE